MKSTLSYRGYSASVAFDAGDQILVGRVLDVDGIISFHADSVAAFTAAFHEAIDDYVQACAKLGQAPEKPVSGRMMLRVAPTVHAAALKAPRKADKA